jgi:clan AA aspartic protease (TIGR02281 family)
MPTARAYLCSLISLLAGICAAGATATDGPPVAPTSGLGQEQAADEKPETNPEAEAADQLLQSKGLARTGRRFLLPAEVDLARKNREVNGLRRSIKEAESAAKKLTEQKEKLDREIDGLMTQRRQLNDRLPSLESKHDQYNEAVRRMNDITLRLDELMRQRQLGFTETKEEIVNRARAAHDALVLHTVTMRTDADLIARRYQAMAEDAQVLEALATLSRIEAREVTIGPSQRFEGTVRAIARLERQFQSERIPLRREGNSFWVTVTLNRRGSKELVFDTGADLVSLPAKMAAEIGLRPGPDDPVIKIRVADGRELDATLMTLSSVQVREFEVKDVPCIVLPATLENAPALLGGSFLNNFIYRVDVAASQLVLYRLADERNARRQRRP